MEPERSRSLPQLVPAHHRPAALPAMEQARGAAPHQLRHSLASDTGELQSLRARLRRLLHDACVSESEQHDIVLATHEAAVNAIVHGNASDARERVEVAVDVSASEVVVRVADAGGGFDWRRYLQRARSGGVPPEALSGRGIIVMVHTMDSVGYSEAGNVVTLRRRLAARG